MDNVVCGSLHGGQLKGVEFVSVPHASSNVSYDLSLADVETTNLKDVDL